MKYSELLVAALALSVVGCEASGAQDPSSEADRVAQEALEAAQEAMKAADEASKFEESEKSSKAARQQPEHEATVAQWPTAADKASFSWDKTALVFDLPHGASFELLIASRNFPACAINSQKSGGLATFRRGDQVAEYGCWWAFQKESDDSTWIHMEMPSGIQLRFPIRAFNKRAAL